MFCYNLEVMGLKKSHPLLVLRCGFEQKFPDKKVEYLSVPENPRNRKLHLVPNIHKKNRNGPYSKFPMVDP